MTDCRMGEATREEDAKIAIVINFVFLNFFGYTTPSFAKTLVLAHDLQVKP